MTLFYSHLVSDLEEIHRAIEQLPVSQKEKREAKKIVAQTIYHAVVESILGHLHEDHHERILFEIYRTPHDRGILTLVSTLCGKNIETILQANLRELQSELLKDLLSDESAVA